MRAPRHETGRRVGELEALDQGRPGHDHGRPGSAVAESLGPRADQHGEEARQVHRRRKLINKSQ
jgi:hypothetical protein